MNMGEVVLRFTYLVTLAACLVIGPSASASAQSCEPASAPFWYDENNQPAHRVYLFFESDMNVEIRTGSSAYVEDDTLTLGQVIQGVMQAAEIWNSTTQGIALVYGGTTTVEDPEDFCNVTSVRPAVFVNYDQMDASNGARVGTINCPGGEVKLLEYNAGARNGDGNWEIGSQGNYFGNVSVHEFGHVLGLDDIRANDPNATPCSTHSGAFSVMNGCVSGQDVPENGNRFPLNWDKDCATAFTPGREVSWSWRPWTQGGVLGALASDSNPTRRGGIAGGYTLGATGDASYSLYLDDSFLWAAPGFLGVINFSQYMMQGNEPSRFGDLDEQPVLTTIHELSSSEKMRVNLLEDGASGSESNPPQARYVPTNSTLWGNPGAVDDYWACFLADCDFFGFGFAVKSHLPVVTAYDPLSGNTIVAWVETHSGVGAGADGVGYIWLHPGFHTAGELQPGLRLDEDELGMPTSSNGWDYTGRTDLAPAIACADNSWQPSAPWANYNCVVAFTEKGLANHFSAVAYNFFRVDENGAIDVYDGDSKIRYATYTAASPALAFVNGKIWLAYKSISPTSRVEVYNSTNGNSWTQILLGNSAGMVDPPTFVYRNGNEFAVAWTTTN